ncbi:MAG TPA: hypothetical protein PKN73_00855 [Candidatus Paceibacterota bacterium]|nr:hypothetical protein [Candidatus Paceibacterota bacterium]HPY13008.1 hypothetical protein [Candidatus Paceibacterota bacterium]HQB26939.1 hypothetical protein [Candidatus Paceibacterota bacterium]
MKKKFKYNQGALLINVLVYGSIGALLIGSLIAWGTANLKLTNQAVIREKALQIAEAGIDYYRWHLAHNKTDFQDGTGAPGPYVHDFADRTGEVVGQFTLDITPPSLGSTLVTINSTGEVDGFPDLTRTIEVKMAVPSFAKYALLANAVMRFGQGTETFGPVHSNEGIRFDGLAHNIVTSAKADYNDPDHDDTGDKNEFGVHTHLNPPPPENNLVSSFRVYEAPPNPVMTRNDVFLAGREFPVPAVDFNGLMSTLSEIKTAAEQNGLYFAPSGVYGYNLVLKTDNTFDLYKVNSLMALPKNNCRKPNWEDQEGWGTWSIGSQTLIDNYSFPANGLIFAEDNIWIEGQIDGARLTIAAARFPENPSTYANINFNRDLLYTKYDGTDVIGLIAQGNINAGMDSNDILRIDAALIAKNGRAGRYYYNNNCHPYHIRDTITLFGMVGTNKRYGFAYTDANGYETRNLIYDGNLLYNPPPFFPLVSENYEIISWREK